MENNASVTKGVSAPEIDVRQLPTAAAFARQSGAITTSPYHPMLIYFAFYISSCLSTNSSRKPSQLVPLTDRNCILSDVLPRKIQLTTFLCGSRPSHPGVGRSRGISCENPLDCSILAPISIILAPGNATCRVGEEGERGRGRGKGNRHRCYKAILTLPDFVRCGDEKLRAFLVIRQPWRDFLL